jgi:hypothetical protein
MWGPHISTQVLFFLGHVFGVACCRLRRCVLHAVVPMYGQVWVQHACIWPCGCASGRLAWTDTLSLLGCPKGSAAAVARHAPMLHTGGGLLGIAVQLLDQLGLARPCLAFRTWVPNT